MMRRFPRIVYLIRIITLTPLAFPLTFGIISSTGIFAQGTSGKVSLWSLQRNAQHRRSPLRLFGFALDSIIPMLSPFFPYWSTLSVHKKFCIPAQKPINNPVWCTKKWAPQNRMRSEVCSIVRILHSCLFINSLHIPPQFKTGNIL